MQEGRKTVRAGVLGATGMVGQRIVRLLEGHPWFRLQAVAASGRSAGRAYGESVRWTLPGELPADAASMTVRRCDPGEMDDCDVVFSSLESAVAREVEGGFVKAGFAVVSNSSAFRMDPGVPLVIPEVNPGHLSLLDRRAEDDGLIVTNPNCSVIGLALAVAPLHEAFGVRRIVVTTMQAVSGAGIDGPRSLDTVDNVLPYIPGEEDKMQPETCKILGEPDGSGDIAAAPIVISAHCHRVAVQDGHLEAVSLELEREATPEQVEEALRTWPGRIRDLGLPSAPEFPLDVRDEPDRPQPRLDRYAGGGMTVTVGRIRPCPALTVRMELLSHNAIRGAAGAAVLNGELLAHEGYLMGGSAT